MKRIRIVQAVLLVAVVAIFASCSSGRNTYGGPYPPRQPQFSLIIHSGPGFVVNRYHDGRYYYRTPQGHIYWRGYDNRYYLDRSYLGRVQYDRRQYNDWRQGHKRYYRRNSRR
jgi:hypothetical protein